MQYRDALTRQETVEGESYVPCASILPPLLRLVLTLGIYCLPSCDWFSRWVYTTSPPAIGSHAGYIPPPLLRTVLALSIYCLPSCDWFSR
eukprot:9466580-Pyramimonas_sp.AAC.2